MKRTTKIITLLAALAALAAPLPLFAQSEQPKVEAIPVAKDVYRFSGTLCNCVLLHTNEGNILIDSSETSGLAEGMKAAIEKLGSPSSVEYLIDTHWHFDHVNGNPVFAQTGATIIGQNAVRTKLQTTPTQEGQALLPADAIPEITFSQDLTIFLGGETIYIYHPETDGAHTMGDSVVYFRNANILVTGDLLFVGMYPYIDPNDNGWPQGMAASLRDMARMIDDKTIVIPGHGPITNKAGMLAFADMLQTVGEKVQSGINDGQSLDQIKASKPATPWDDSLGKGWMNSDSFVELVWNTLKNHR